MMLMTSFCSPEDIPLGFPLAELGRNHENPRETLTLTITLTPTLILNLTLTLTLNSNPNPKLR